ncbi:transcription antitermination factor NusB [Candidatus Roizmanbacteria bacterium]|nr:transcription antitermination factor NusB [Candidatus Roizmanbacteria bacterium]
MDPRHLKRIETLQNLFAFSFRKVKTNLPYPDDERTKGILKHIEKIDRSIEKFAKRYPLDLIAKTDLAILRLSIYELTFEKKIPQKVVIDEAIELAKEFSGEKSYGFINAILGKVLESSTH